ncbi:MAG: low molecular weight protein-tyrosine-phosphatase [Thermoleophilia bacterium]
MRISFVCLGNICRSPTAEAVMRDLVAREGLADRILVESAGTGAWHLGDPPDGRAQQEAGRRGLAMTSRARQFTARDFDRLDLVLAMDSRNAADLRAIAPTPDAAAKVRMLREFAPGASGDLDVPDPYFGGADGFRDVFDMVQEACRGLLDHLRPRLAARR